MLFYRQSLLSFKLGGIIIRKGCHVLKCNALFYSDEVTVIENASQSASDIETVKEACKALRRQGTEEWQNLRKDRLTASVFAYSLGLWKDGRVNLWEEKVRLKERFSGNEATQWGVEREAEAIAKYQGITGNVVEFLDFKIYKEGNDLYSWLGASPDGLINTTQEGKGGGILEVKCPYNKGKPMNGLPWSRVPYYYMPQAQGLMEILDREWMDFFVWTVRESTLFRINRDKRYWSLMYGVLSEFWWGNVIPARKAVLLSPSSSSGPHENVSLFKPASEHFLTKVIMRESLRLSHNSVLIFKTERTPLPLSSPEKLKNGLVSSCS